MFCPVDGEQLDDKKNGGRETGYLSPTRSPGDVLKPELKRIPSHCKNNCCCSKTSDGHRVEKTIQGT